MSKVIYLKKTVDRKITYEPINDVFCQYKDVIEEIDSNGVVTSNVEYGVATIEEISSINDFRGITRRAKVDWMSGSGIYERVIQITKVAFDRITTSSCLLNECDFVDNDVPYDPEKYVYCIYSPYSWQMADLNGEIIIKPILVDYIDGGICSDKYDLKGVLEFMKNDKRYIPYSGYRELEIMNIPGYNLDESFGGDKAIEFCYIPQTKEEALNLEITRTTKGKYEKMKLIAETLSQFKITK